MKHDEEKVKDPVCERLVDPKRLAVEYLQLRFAPSNVASAFLPTPAYT